jgi:hypothetical protein
VTRTALGRERTRCVDRACIEWETGHESGELWHGSSMPSVVADTGDWTIVKRNYFHVTAQCLKCNNGSYILVSSCTYSDG